ncbi:GNAT family N-acetyltransferase [Streptomyces sp. NEAU-H3]|uniref:GNAT family N-acetyltransferase n=1 Tax=unclassified Streptomyces TaxID=2593676 RepID=UPI00143BA2CE|nr:GNAT family N-acetyltransferase [Streptomyces sp. NEAU-H3]NJA56109.1 GNAT family N-acetyltransferase [Streptomyces sp. NEAU-H3]
MDARWAIAPEPHDSPTASDLWRAYYTEVSDRWYRLREGRDTDRDELARALAASDHSPLAPPHGLLLVGRYGGEAAGCVGLRASRLGPDALELTRMYVRPAFRGLGGGGLLLRAAEVAGRERGARRLDLDTRHDLVEARGLYARHGWRETGPLWEDVYAERWFRKELGAAEGPGAEEVPGAAA